MNESVYIYTLFITYTCRAYNLYTLCALFERRAIDCHATTANKMKFIVRMHHLHVGSLGTAIWAEKRGKRSRNECAPSRTCTHTHKNTRRALGTCCTPTLCVAARCSSECGGGSGGARSLQLLNVRLSAPLIKIKSCFALRRNNNVFPQ
jgi:hypothetical protein